MKKGMIFLATAMLMGGAVSMAQTAPCSGVPGNVPPTYESPKEWNCSKDDTLTITWQSAAPLQRFDYRLSYNDPWLSKETHGSFMLTADAVKDAEKVEFRIVVGYSKYDYEAVYDTVAITRKNEKISTEWEIN